MAPLEATLQRLRGAATAANAAEASQLDIAPAAAVTCVKPSGTVSQLVDAASGIHPRHSRHYVRRVRGSNADPLTRFLADAGVPNEPCAYNRGSTVLSLHVVSGCSHVWCTLFAVDGSLVPAVWVVFVSSVFCK